MKRVRASLYMAVVVMLFQWASIPFQPLLAGDVPPDILSAIEHDALRKYPHDLPTRDAYIEQQKTAYLQVRE